MERANWHTYQVLTKRSSRLRNCFRRGCNSPPASPTFGGGLASRTKPTAWFGSSIFSRPQPLSDSCPSSLCWKTSARSTWKESTG